MYNSGLTVTIANSNAVVTTAHSSTSRTLWEISYISLQKSKILASFISPLGSLNKTQPFTEIDTGNFFHIS